MKILKFCLVFTAIALFIFACNENKPTNSNTANTNKPVTNTNATTQSTTVADEFAETRKIYSVKCVRCHKEDGTGGKTEIDGVKIKASNLGSDHLKKHSDDEIFGDIKDGIVEENMPAFKKQLTDDEINGLVKFIRKEFQKQ